MRNYKQDINTLDVLLATGTVSKHTLYCISGKRGQL